MSMPPPGNPYQTPMPVPVDPAKATGMGGLGPTDEERLWATLAHLSGLALSFLGPLIVLLVKKDSPFIQEQGKEAFNFQLTWFLISLVSAVTCIGPIVVGVVAIVFMVQAAIAVNQGKPHRYPLTWRVMT